MKVEPDMKLTMQAFRRGLTALTAAGLTLSIAACAEGGSDAPAAANDVVKIVASTPIWGDIAKKVANEAETDAESDEEPLDGKKINVVTILTSTDDDPHEYEATARDLAELQDADIIAANGAGYDNWLTNNADLVPVVSALPLAEDHDHSHGDDHDDEHSDHDDEHDHGEVNPHAWFDMEIVDDFADRLAAQIHDLDPTFPKQLPEDSELKEHTADITKRLDKLPKRNVVVTEPVADAAIEHSSLTDITPQSFAEAVAREAEPSAADLAATRELIENSARNKNGEPKVDILITNEQSQTPAAEQLITAAEDAKITVININETPERDETYFDYVDHFLSELED